VQENVSTAALGFTHNGAGKISLAALTISLAAGYLGTKLGW